jgi:threonine dehydrogenase-like Zn-dependent dehydrogenase
LVEPLAVAWHAVEQSATKAGDNILIIGAGPIGLAILQCLKAFKTAQVIVAEVAKNRRALAREFGATAVIDPKNEDVVSTCKTLCNNQGPEVAFDCAGVAASIKSACLSVRSRGTVVNVAKWDKEVPFNPDDLLIGEKKLVSGKPP